LLLQRTENQHIDLRQLNTVLEIMRQRPELVIRLLPKGRGRSHLLIGAFTIYSFDDEENAALYRERSVTDEFVQNAEEIGRHRQRFEEMWDLCLTPEATAIALEAQRAHLRDLMSRGGSSELQG